MRLTPYLYFRGACEEALKFYEACGLGAIVLLRRYEGTPMAERDGGAWRDKASTRCSKARACASAPRTVPIRSR